MTKNQAKRAVGVVSAIVMLPLVLLSMFISLGLEELERFLDPAKGNGP